MKSPVRNTLQVSQLCSGPCLALQVGLAGQGEEVASMGQEEVVARLREVCGPANPATAKLIRPKSLRAR